MTKPLDDNPADFSRPQDEDTIELELSVEQMCTLSRADEVSQLDPVPVPSTEESLPKLPPPAQGAAALQGRTRSKGSRVARIAVVSSIVAASIVLSGIAYLATPPAPPVQIVADTGSDSTVPEAPAPPPADNEAVRFKNPFDAKEVFEFPSGTTESEAREAVAELLLQRARERRSNRLSRPSK